MEIKLTYAAVDYKALFKKYFDWLKVIPDFEFEEYFTQEEQKAIKELSSD